MQELLKSVRSLSQKERKALAALLKRQGVNLYGITPVLKRSPEEPLQLSYAQQRQWFLWQLEPGSAAYHIPAVLRLHGELDTEALKRSFAALGERHEVLRTTFRQEGDETLQVVHDDLPLELREETMSGTDESALLLRIEDEVLLPFDLERGPLLRVLLLRLSAEEQVLVVTLHHIVSDGWSTPIMVEELMQFYAGYREGRAVELEPLPIQYADYALWQRSWMEAGERERQLAYWRQQLGGEQPVLELPTDRPRPSVQSPAGDSLQVELGEDLGRSLKQLAQQQGVTLFMLLLASFQTLLHRYSGQPEIRVGVPIANRTRVETERLIGFFVNTQVLKADFDLETRFDVLLQQVKRTALEAQAHQDLPFEQLVEALQPQRSLSHSPLFQVMYNHQNAGQGKALELPGLRVEALERASATAQFDLTLDTYESGDALSASLIYATSLFERSTVERLAAHWRNLLEAICQDASQRVGELPMLAEAEYVELVRGCESAPCAEPACLHPLVEAQAARTPEATAVVHGEIELSYRELNRRANVLAHRLRAEGVGPDVPVGIAMQRSPELVVALLAVLKAGGAYVPMDPGYPAERLAFLAEDSGIGLLLTQTFLQDELPFNAQLTNLCLDDPSLFQNVPAQWDGNPEQRACPEHLAYVIYTSGSTGRPKGVGITHGALVNHMRWMQERFQLAAHERVLQRTSSSFDASVWEFWLPLMSGARLHLAPAELGTSLESLWGLVEAQRINVLQMPPSLLQALLPFAGDDQLDSLRLLCCGGEALSGALLEQLGRRWNGELVNLYGPTEATIDACCFSAPVKEVGGEIPIGAPIAGVRARILDAAGGVCPVGCRGELLIAGAGLARGYLGRPGLTAERFVPDPYGDGERIYRTGDLARLRRDGQIDYLGRLDHQVKIRGFRIELGEIEARLLEQECVREAVVLAADGASGQQLLGYVVPQDVGALEGEKRGALREALKSALKASLPEYMVPTQWVFLAALPLLPNGKLDRKALPAPEAGDSQQVYAAPETDLEQQLATIWAEVLKLERVGLTDNFFELGGDSIISLQVVSRARQAGIQFTPKDLFQHQTVQGVASVARFAPALAVDQGPVSGSMPLTPVQRRFFAEAIPQRNHWNQSLLLAPADSLEPVLLREALQAVVSRHDALRLRFDGVDEEWQAAFDPAACAEDVLWVRQLADGDLSEVVEAAQRSLDLKHGPLLRVLLADLPDGSQRLLLVVHHLVVDGVSWRILLEDLQQAYQSLQAGQAPNLPAKTSSFKAWADRLKEHASSEAVERELCYWRQALEGVSTDLPCERPEGGRQQRHVAHADTRLPRETTRRLLQEAPAAYRTQVNDLLLTALARVVCRWSGRAEVLVRLEGHGREDLFEDIDLTRTVGWFTSLYPVRLSPRQNLADSVKAIKEQLRSIPSRGIGYGLLRYLGSAEARRTLETLPEGEIVFNYLGQFDGSFDEQRGLFAPAREDGGAVMDEQAPLGALLSVDGRVYDGELSLGWTFSREVFDEQTIQALADEYGRELQTLVEHCCQERNRGVTPSDFPLANLDQAELDALPVPAGEIADLYPLSPMQQGMLFHSLYEQGGSDYVNQMRVDVEGLDVEAFHQAWLATVASHEVLRANILTDLERPLQLIHKQVRLPFEVFDWSAREDLEQALESYAQDVRRKGFDLTREPLLRIAVIRAGEGRHHLVYTNHHILMDGWSGSRLLGEVLERYAGRLPASLAGRYRDYIAWLQRQDQDAAGRFWKEQLAELDAPTRLMQALAGQVKPVADGYGDHYQLFDAEQTRRLDAFARAQRVTLNTLVQSAWLLLLQRYTGQETVCFGATVAGRPMELSGIEQQIGLFINTLPVICRPRADLSVVDWVAMVQERNLALREYEHTPLFEVQRWAGQGGESLFDSLLVFENYPVSEALEQGAPAGLRFGEVVSREQTNYPLTLAVNMGETLTIHYSYDRLHLDAVTVERLATHWRNLLEAICQDANRSLGELPLLDRSERDLLLARWDQTGEDYPSRPFVHQLVAEQARRAPEAIAVLFGEQRLSYGELDSQANRLAQRLVELGVGPEVRVAIAMRRSAEIMVAFLAVLKAGGAYVPLDIAYPAERLRYMLEDCGAALVLTQRDVLERLPLPAGLASLAVDDPGEWQDRPEGAPEVDLAEENLAYVIYTSGSTGLPKGVAVSHGPLVSHIRATGERYETSPADCELHFMSFAFDGAHEGWMHPLINGARVLVRDDSIWLPEETYAQMHRHGVTIGVFPPVYLQQLAEHAERDGNPPPVRVYCFGGDAVPQASYELAWESLRPDYLFNGYGPTETVVTPLLWKARPQDPCGAAYAPIGTLLGRRRAYVLGADLDLLPLGLAGELYLGGEGVARGYLDRPALTAERFVPDPYGNGERVYRSGDLTRARADGLVDYLGRVDHQVKIRGFRIELGEIEARLLEQECVREAVVLARDGASGKQLVGYVVPQDVGALEDEKRGALREVLKSALKASLPEYMVPTQWVFLAALPLTPNGKLDRKALPAPDASESQQQYVAPATELERTLAAIWADVLKLERVGMADNFFELGGDSIISLQLVSRARQAGIRFTPKDLFQYQTIQGLAGAVRFDTGQLVDQGPVLGSMPLMPIQQRFFEEDVPERHHWNQSLLLEPSEALDPQALQGALAALVEQHDALRLRYMPGERGWQAEFLPQEASEELLWERTLDATEELEEVIEACQRSLDLRHGPLLRALLATLPDGSQRLLLVVHHLVVDGVSWRILLEDLQQAYQALATGEMPHLPAKTSSFKAWAERVQEHARGPALKSELAYWQAQLQGLSDNLPCDNPHGRRQLKHAAYVGGRLEREWTRRLLQQAPAAYRTQINDLLLTALARVVCRWSGEAEVLVRLEGHGREDLFEDIDLSRTVGWFTSLYPLRLSPRIDLVDSIKTIKEQIRAVPNKGIGYGLLRYLGDDEARTTLGCLPEGQLVFNYLGQFDGSFDQEQGLFVPAREGSGAERSDEAVLDGLLALSGQVYDGELSLQWTFSREVFEEATIQRLADEYLSELQALVAHCCEERNRGLTPSDFPLADIDQARLDSLPLPVGSIADLYPLSPMQQGMLFHSLYEEGAGDYINQMQVEVEGLDVARFRLAWEATLEAHDVLRSGFVWEGELGRPLQVVHKSVSLPFAEHDWRGRTDLESALEDLADQERLRTFDLQQAPLLRWVSVRVADHRHRLIYTNHHILMDGWSGSLLLGEVLERYSGRQPAPQAGRYRDYIAWLQRQDRESAERYWKERLAELDAPTRLAQAIRCELLPASGHGHFVHAFDPVSTQHFEAFARTQRVTLNTLVQSAWLLLLQRYTGQDTVCFGATVAGRPMELPGIEQQVGLFINTLPVIASPRADLSVVDWISQVQDCNLGLREYEHTPLYEVQRWAGQGGEGLFDSLLVFENYPVSEALEQGAPSGLRFGEVENREQTNYPLTLSVGLGETLQVQYSYDRRYLDSETVERLASHWRNLLEAMCRAPEIRLGELRMLDEDERQRYLALGGDMDAEYPRGLCLHTLFEAQAGRFADAPAVLFDGELLTYGELNRRANRLAHYLLAEGVGTESLVGIAMERGPDMLVGLLAVLKAGAAYVPLDPDYPRERLAYMLEDSGVRLVLSQSWLSPGLPLAKGVAALDLDRTGWLDGYPSNDPLRPLAAENLAYVIYTSGSTGRPKGVQIEHRSLLNFLASMAREPGCTSSDRLLQLTSLSFDIAGLELYLGLTRGACIVMPKAQQSKDPQALLALIEEAEVSIIQATPATWRMLLDGAPERAEVLRGRKALCGGEALGGGLARRLLAHVDSLWNVYGPTETTIWSSCQRVLDSEVVHLGRPIGNTALHVLDDELEPMPAGGGGELLIGGDGLARGYFARPALTAERFVPNPFDAHGGRLYRTGDLASRRSDGVIDYLGRVDHQVKIRGFRIELGEIEARLQEQGLVREAVVLAQEGAHGAQLVGYVVPITSELAPDWRDVLRNALKGCLPEYMVPAQLVALERLPLTPNGKIDRKALPKPDAGAQTQAYAPPQTEAEKDLARLWREVLGVERVGLHDNFFELGGDSILAVQLVGRIRLWRAPGLEISLRDLMHKPTIAALLESRSHAGSPLVSLNRGLEQVPPLFCIHGIFGTAFDYLPLARRMEGRRTVIGIQSPLLSGYRPEGLAMRELARQYAGLIRQRQPQGPYSLMGWSLGAVISLFVARELEKQGEEVVFLGLADAPLVDGRGRSDQELGQVLDEFLEIFLGTRSRLPAEASVDASVVASHIRAQVAEKPVRHGLTADELIGVFETVATLRKLCWDAAELAGLVAGAHCWWVEGREAEARQFQAQMSFTLARETFCQAEHDTIMQDERLLQELDEASERSLKQRT